MADPQAARLTQLRNIQAKTGKSLEELHGMLVASGRTKVGECRTLLMERFGLGYGDANAVALLLGKPLPTLDGGAPASSASTTGDALLSIYAGSKASLRPLHEAVMQLARNLGPFEEAPKQSYVSLRRRKQFAMLGPATKDTIEIGLNHKALPPSARLKVVPAGGMCQYKLRISSMNEVDDQLAAWLGAAYDSAA